MLGYSLSLIVLLRVFCYECWRLCTCVNADKAQIDNFPDRLHYKVTTGFLFMATAILSMEVHFTVRVVSSVQ